MRHPQRRPPTRSAPPRRNRRGGAKRAAVVRWWWDPTALSQRAMSDLHRPVSPKGPPPLAHSSIHPTIVPKQGFNGGGGRDPFVKAIAASVHSQLSEIQRGDKPNISVWRLKDWLSDLAEGDGDGYADTITNMCSMLDKIYLAGDYPDGSSRNPRATWLAHDEAYRAAKDDAAACRRAAADEYNAKHFKDLRPARPRTGAGLSQCADQAFLAPSEPDDESSDLEEGFSAGAGLPARAGKARSAPSDDESSEGFSDDYGLD